MYESQLVPFLKKLIIHQNPDIHDLVKPGLKLILQNLQVALLPKNEH